MRKRPAGSELITLKSKNVSLQRGRRISSALSEFARAEGGFC